MATFKRYEVFSPKRGVEGIFRSQNNNRWELTGEDFNVVGKVWDGLYSPSYNELSSSEGQVVFFFTEKSIQEWDLRRFATILHSTSYSPSECFEINLEVEYIDSKYIVFEDEYQIAIDADYYERKLQDNIRVEKIHECQGITDATSCG